MKMPAVRLTEAEHCTMYVLLVGLLSCVSPHYPITERESNLVAKFGIVVKPRENCPRCGSSTLGSEVDGGGVRCGSCGLLWGKWASYTKNGTS